MINKCWFRWCKDVSWAPLVVYKGRTALASSEIGALMNTGTHTVALQQTGTQSRDSRDTRKQ